MPANHETGHAKNVENFARLDDHIISLGSRYAPADPRLQPPNIAAVRQNALDALAALAAAVPPYLHAVSRREAAFAGVDRLASRALAMAETLRLDAASIRALKELVRKLYGRRAVPKKSPATSGEPNPETTRREHRTISVARLSFDQRAAHFAQFVAILRAEHDYRPLETDLSVDSLAARLDEMRAAADPVTQTALALANARYARNAVLYSPLDGLVDLALDIKKYFLAAFGRKSHEYRAIKGLRFRRA